MKAACGYACDNDLDPWNIKSHQVIHQQEHWHLLILLQRVCLYI